STGIGLTTGDGTDAAGPGTVAAGLDTTTRLTERAPATSLSNGTCTFPGSPSFTSVSTAANPTDNPALASNCYRYRYSIKDKVTNTSGFATLDVKVDVTTPSNGTLAVTKLGTCDGAVFYNTGTTTLYYN